MRHGPLIIGILLLGTLVAGCTTPDGQGDDAPGGSLTVDPSDPDARTLAGQFTPWTLSDYWVYDMDVRGLGRFDSTKLVYYEESGPEYVVGAPTYDEAVYHAVFSVNPILGRIHKQLLSPHERGVHSHMFPFHKDPVIEDGEKWTTTFYERQLALTATYDEAVETPTGTQPGYRIEGTDPNSEFRLSYSFVRAVKWFTYLEATDADGTLFRLDLTESGTGHSGPAYFIRAKDLLHETIASTGNVLTTQATFRIGDGEVSDRRVESLAISADIEMRSGIDARLLLRDPAGNEIWSKRYQDAQSGEYNIEEVYPTGAPQKDRPVEERAQWSAGTYTLEFRFSGEASADVHIVGTQDNSGSV